MLKRWTTMLAILSLLAAPAALAQGDQKIFGTVTAHDETTLTIETEQGQLVTFEINEQSLIPQSLSVGDKVSVHHQASDGDNNLQPITEVLVADDLDVDLDDRDVDLDNRDVELDDRDNDLDDRVNDRFSNRSNDVLPQTASPLAALALIGFAALGGASAIRRLRS